MKALAIVRGKEGIQMIEVEEPRITKSDEVKIKIISAGIDGTDRAILSHGLLDPPEGDEFLILGHEAVGEVVETGDKVTDLQPGDLVVPTVRRGCGLCAPCLNNQSDMCSTGLYKERGIHKLHGYFTHFIVEEERYLVKIPAEILDCAVLVEPLSISEKALKEVRYIQGRLPWACMHPEHRYTEESWGNCKKAMVIGIGSLGFLAAALLRYYSLPVFALVNRGSEDIRVRLLKTIGAFYLDARDITPAKVIEAAGNPDLIIESSGASDLALNLIPALARNGIFVLTGIPRGEQEVCLDGNLVLRQTVRNNQILMGSVNSNRSHFKLASDHLGEFKKRFGECIDNIITGRYGFDEYETAFGPKKKDELKAVIELTDRLSVPLKSGSKA